MRHLELSAEDFRQLAHDIADFTTNYLEALPQVRSYPRGVTGSDTERLFGTAAPLQGKGVEAFELLPTIFEWSRPPSPRFFGYVFGSGDPVAALGEFAASVLHQNVSAWRSAPAATAIERTVVRWLAEALGCMGFSGSLTSGGSAANLMALCMARHAMLSDDRPAQQLGVIYCSTEAHMSIQKAAKILGLGRQGVRVVSVDETFRMRVDCLRDSILKDLEDGRIPIAVVASAGTTATGSIDPLEEIASVCREFRIWMHVDGAYGALASLVVPHLFQGLAHCDSLSIDPHKWLYQPTGCGCLLYRDSSIAKGAFAYSDSYAEPLSQDPVEGFAFFEESIELSRPFRALGLWLSLRYHGIQAFQESIHEDLRLAQVLKDAVLSECKLQLLAPVALSAVCFRFVGSSTNFNALNRTILERVIERGRVYISNTTINGVFALRACIVNHRSTEEDVRAIVDEVLAVAAELLGT